MLRFSKLPSKLGCATRDHMPLKVWRIATRIIQLSVMVGEHLCGENMVGKQHKQLSPKLRQDSAVEQVGKWTRTPASERSLVTAIGPQGDVRLPDSVYQKARTIGGPAADLEAIEAAFRQRVEGRHNLTGILFQPFLDFVKESPS